MTGTVCLMEPWEELEMKYFYFASSGILDGLKLMLQSGIDIDATDYNNRTALHMCADNGHVECVRYLISQGASLNCKDFAGLTPYDLAAHRGYQSIMKRLFRANAKSDDQSMRQKATCPMHAVFAVMETFPRPIAMAMLEGKSVGQISRDQVSLFFSEVVGFNDMRSSMDSCKVANMLSRLFKKFDALGYQHGVQKIDIIGDTYVAATNFIEDQSSDHAARMARFALDALKAARETRIDEETDDTSSTSSCSSSSSDAAICATDCVQIRVGLHCGPVSGSVVGSQNLKYTLLGDTVNTASRMQSTGLPGWVQCSAAMAALVADQAHDVLLSPRRGGVKVKGKGLMHTSWLDSLRHGLRRNGSCPHSLHAAHSHALNTYEIAPLLPPTSPPSGPPAYAHAHAPTIHDILAPLPTAAGAHAAAAAAAACRRPCDPALPAHGGTDSPVPGCTAAGPSAARAVDAATDRAVGSGSRCGGGPPVAPAACGVPEGKGDVTAPAPAACGIPEEKGDVTGRATMGPVSSAGECATTGVGGSAGGAAGLRPRDWMTASSQIFRL